MDSYQETVFKLKRYWSDRGCSDSGAVRPGSGRGHDGARNVSARARPKAISASRMCSPAAGLPTGAMARIRTGFTSTSSLQVILKPTPDDVLEQYLGSLAAIGIDLRKHDIKFEEDNWESPTLGAWGIGWQVMLDGLEITQFTYFQQCGGMDLELVPAEITYGLERIVAFLQGVESVYDIEWAPGFKYADVRLADEQQFSVYNFEMADVDAAVAACSPNTKRSAGAARTIQEGRRKAGFRCWLLMTRC